MNEIEALEIVYALFKESIIDQATLFNEGIVTTVIEDPAYVEQFNKPRQVRGNKKYFECKLKTNLKISNLTKFLPEDDTYITLSEGVLRIIYFKPL